MDTAELRVLLVANYLPDRQWSMQRYCTMLSQGLKKAGVDVTVIRPRSVFGQFGRIGSKIRRYFGYVDKFLIFPLELAIQVKRFAHRGNCVVHVIDQGNGIYLRRLRKVPHLLTCHDLIAIRSRTQVEGPNLAPKRRSVYQECNLRALREARWIACVSRSSRQDCLRLLRTDPSRCRVIYNALDPFFAEEESSEHPPEFPPSYLVHVGNSGWYKNRTGVLRIFREMLNLGWNSSLLLLGEPLSATECDLVDDLQLRHRLKVISNPDDRLVRSAYAHAEALIFPSLHEGFGWPILEGLAQGTITFTTNAMPMTEVGGSVAWYIDPRDPRQAAELISSVLLQHHGDPKIEAAGRAHARSFSINRFVAEHVNLYKEIVGESGLNNGGH